MIAYAVIGVTSFVLAFLILLPYGLWSARLTEEDCEDAIARMLLEEEARADRRAVEAEFEGIEPIFELGVADELELLLGQER
jgi:hypothetical protein